MKIAVYQGDGVMADLPANLDLIGRKAQDAADAGAKLVVFPELFLTGYNIGAAVQNLAEPLDGPNMTALSTTAQAAGLAIVCGYPERHGDQIFNSAALIDDQGRLQANYRKTHLFGDFEKAYFTAGDGLVVTEIAGFTVGLLICYDIEFPEPARALALQGVELLLVPTALMTPATVVARRVVPTRACENQIFVAYANRPGQELDLAYVGESCIVGPDGEDLARAGDEEDLIFATLDRAQIGASRQGYSYLADRRTEMPGPTPSDGDNS